MADTTVYTGTDSLNVQEWSDQAFIEFVRANRFRRFMGKGVGDIFQMKQDLTKMDGDQITFPLVTRLTGNGVTGDNLLEDNEEAMSSYGYKVTVAQRRNAVRMGKAESKKTNLDMLNIAKPLLKTWSMEKLRDDIIARLLCPVTNGTTAYASATDGQKDTWVAANDDRVLFGNAVGNYVTGDHSASLLTIDSTDDTLDTGILDLAKRRIDQADPHFRPYNYGDDEEVYICFVGPLGMRDLRSDSVMQQANRDAMQRGKENPTFRAGNLLWAGMTIVEIPELSVISGVGNGGIDVEPYFICGAQAIAIAWGEATHAIFQEKDYKNRKGVGIAEMLGVAKFTFNTVQHGVFSGYVSGVADS